MIARFVKTSFSVSLLTLKRVSNNKTRVLVWYLGSVIQPLLMLFFWKNASTTTGTNFNLNAVQNYYLLYALLANFIICHPEDGISRDYIRGGKLSEFLLRPFSPNLFFYTSEIAYRIFQLLFGVLAIFFIMLITNTKLSIDLGWNILPIIPIIFLSQALVFVYKLIMAYITFYLFEADSLTDFMNVILFLGAGSVAPLSLYPPRLSEFLHYTPFPYMIYYPISLLTGETSATQIVSLVPVYFFWIACFALLSYALWKNGLKIFATSS